MVFGNYNKWRKTPILKPRLGNMLPGFTYAVGLFAVYCVGDYLYNY